jgi:integrase
LKPAEIGKLLRRIDGYPGHVAMRAYLQILAATFPRPTELRMGEWSEIDFDQSLWVIPASRMKMRNRTPSDHLLPLAPQSMEILEELREHSDGKWVFPQQRKTHQHLDENAANNALRKIGYGSGVHTAHSFRVMASTTLHELGFAHEAIEVQLAHSKGAVSGIYDRSNLLDQRRKMLQAWADYLDSLREGGKVIPINSKAPSKEGPR